ncbi:MerR family transcriptional regulator [Thioclava litoralis]|uniref:MerR family transcriptional regulator n=1 Tax=Thioclava litoralis TaxID=3076557 RepID=A0ABZ1E2H4_9RHOB|nr:MerR family transcriptional regulator [Thioclava sp. FTW29]
MAKAADAFRTISETSEIVGVPSHVLRFWEGKFPQVKPTKRAGNRRYYRPDDIALLSGIRQLLHEDGLTIRGVQKVLKEQGVRHVCDLGRLHLPPDDAPDAPFAQPAPPLSDMPRAAPPLPSDAPLPWDESAVHGTQPLSAPEAPPTTHPPLAAPAWSLPDAMTDPDFAVPAHTVSVEKTAEPDHDAPSTPEPQAEEAPDAPISPPETEVIASDLNAATDTPRQTEPQAASEGALQPHDFLPELEPAEGEEVMDTLPDAPAQPAHAASLVPEPEVPDGPSFADVWEQTPLFADETDADDDDDISALIEDEEDISSPAVLPEAMETAPSEPEGEAEDHDAPEQAAPELAEPELAEPELVEPQIAQPPAPPRPSAEQSAAALATVTLPQSDGAGVTALPPTRISVLVARISTIKPDRMTRTEQVALSRAVDKLHALRRELSREIRP